MNAHRFTAIIEKEDDLYVAVCPQLDIAGQGYTIEKARRNLLEAVNLFFETASPAEISERLGKELEITSIEIRHG